MTKFVHMTQPPSMTGKSHSTMPLWPIVVAGALLGATWSGIESDVMRSNGIDSLKVAVAALKPWVDDLHGYLDGN
jgi:hypothetical protein